MKHYQTATFKKVLFTLLTLGILSHPAAAENDNKHELENMHVTIQATEFKSSQFIETEVIKGKEYIRGKASSYNKKGEANAGILLQPHAEYAIKSKLPGGTYNITVFYQIDTDKAPSTPKISIGMNTQKAQDIEIKNKLVNSVKTSFKVKLLKGKQHTVKLWFPSAGVKVREIRINKAILPKKDSSK